MWVHVTEAVLTSNHNLCFGAKNKKNRYTTAYPNFAKNIKWGIRGYTVPDDIDIFGQYNNVNIEWRRKTLVLPTGCPHNAGVLAGVCWTKSMLFHWAGRAVVCDFFLVVHYVPVNIFQSGFDGDTEPILSLLLDLLPLDVDATSSS